LFRARSGNAAINTDRFGGWGRTARGGVEVHDFSCDHMDMFNEPHCRDMGMALRDCLERAEAGTGGSHTTDGPVATAAAASI
jgi:hypothetical protein